MGRLKKHRREKKIMIRPYSDSDFKEVKQLIDKWYVSLFEDDHYVKFVAVDKRIEGVVVASMTLTTANLDFLFVHEQCRSQGIGPLLIDRVNSWSKAKNAEGLGVNCGVENVRAQKFYVREGFKEVGRVFNYFSNNNWQVFYWRKVK